MNSGCITTACRKVVVQIFKSSSVNQVFPASYSLKLQKLLLASLARSLSIDVSLLVAIEYCSPYFLRYA